MQTFTPRSVRTRTHLINFTIDFIITSFLAATVHEIFLKQIISSDTVFALFFLLVYFVYYFFLEAGVGYTIGKLVTGTRLVSRENIQPDNLIVFFRCLIRIAPILNLFDMISYLHPSREGIHDRWCGTRLIDKNKKDI